MFNIVQLCISHTGKAGNVSHVCVSVCPHKNLTDTPQWIRFGDLRF